MAPAHHPFAARSRTTPTAHEYWGQDRRRGRLSRSQAPARPSTNDHTDRETARKSSSTPHRSRRCVPDRLHYIAPQIERNPERKETDFHNKLRVAIVPQSKTNFGSVIVDRQIAGMRDEIENPM